MKRKALIAVVLAVLSILGAIAFLRSFNAVSFLTHNRRATIEVDGTPVQGDLLEGRLTAIVTRRDAGKR